MNEKKTLFRYVSWGFFYVSVLFLLINNSLSYLDPDFGWHWRFGEAVWQSAEIPRDQTYSWLLEGKSWVNHEWLADTLLYGLGAAGDYRLITITFALLIVATLIVINRHVFRYYLTRPVDRFVFGALELFYVLAILPNSGVRVQEISVLFLAWLLIIIDRIIKEHNPRAAFWFLPLFYAWACLHGGFLLGLAVLIGWLIYEWLARAARRLPRRLTNYLRLEPSALGPLPAITLIAAAAFAATFFTPYGPELYSFLKDYTNTAYLTYIQEWRPLLSSLPLNYFKLFFIVIGLALAVWGWWYKKNLALWRIVLLAGLAFLSLKSIRHFPLFGVAALVAGIPAALSGLIPNLPTLYARWLLRLAVVCLIMISGMYFMAASEKMTSDPFAAYCHDYPCGAIEFLRQNPEYENLKLVNDYSWGGFLIGVWPEKKLFIDGRLPQYPYGEHTVIEEYVSLNDSDHVAQKLKDYGAELVLWKHRRPPVRLNWFERHILLYPEPVAPSADAVRTYLDSSPDWSLVYDNGNALVYVKTNR